MTQRLDTFDLSILSSANRIVDNNSDSGWTPVDYEIGYYTLAEEFKKKADKWRAIGHIHYMQFSRIRTMYNQQYVLPSIVEWFDSQFNGHQHKYTLTYFNICQTSSGTYLKHYLDYGDEIDDTRFYLQGDPFGSNDLDIIRNKVHISNSSVRDQCYGRGRGDNIFSFEVKNQYFTQFPTASHIPQPSLHEIIAVVTSITHNEKIGICKWDLPVIKDKFRHELKDRKALGVFMLRPDDYRMPVFDDFILTNADLKSYSDLPANKLNLNEMLNNELDFFNKYKDATITYMHENYLHLLGWINFKFDKCHKDKYLIPQYKNGHITNVINESSIRITPIHLNY